MEKVLNQEEIDAMVRKARSGSLADTSTSTQAYVESWDVRRAGQIGRSQLKAITQLHESFARNLTHSLGAFLRVVFSATLVSAEHLTYREFLQRLPETTYLACCRLDPPSVKGTLQLDLKVAFPIIDLLLGGEGKPIDSAREITEIEEQILDSVARVVCREMSIAWQALSLDVQLEKRLDGSEARRLMPPDEKTLCLSFEVTMPELRGGLNFAVPATVSNALLRKISADWTHPRPTSNTESRQRLMRKLLDCPFLAELGATNLKLPIRALSEIVPGSVFSFARPATEPASLLVAGTELFHASPARCGSTRSAKMLAPISSLKSSTANEDKSP